MKLSEMKTNDELIAAQRRTDPEFLSLVLTLVTHGCPLLAIEQRMGNALDAMCDSAAKRLHSQRDAARPCRRAAMSSI